MISGKSTYEELEQRVKEFEKEAVEHKAAQQALRLSEQRLSLIYDSVADILYYIRVEPDDCFRFLSINHGFLIATGLTKDQIVGKRIEEVIPEASVWLALDNYKKAIEENRIVRWVETSVYPAGEKIGEVSIAPVLNEKGICTHLVGSVHDVTERKQSEKALRESEEKHRTLLENIPQKIFFKDTDSIYVSCNENYAKDLKINSEEITGKTDYEFYPKKLAEKYREDDKKIIQLGATEEIEEEYIQNGQNIIVQTVKTPVRDEIGNVTGILGIFGDITERKRTEEALRDSEERYRALADAAFEAIFISEKGICTNTNQAATKMFGYKYDELIGIFGADVIAPESKELVKHNMLSEHEKPYEALAQRKDGTTFHTEIRGKMTRYKGKGVRITVVNDIEVRKRAEDTLRQAHDELEMKVEKRTYELVKANERLKNEIKDHRRTELTLIARRRELENKTLELEEVNTALKVLLKQRDEDKKELEEKVIANVKKLVFPYIEKLNNSRLNNQQAVYLDIIKSNLEHVIAPFLHQLFSKYSDLTPKEIQIAGLVKDGKTTKEISEFLNSTTGAVDFHRNNLRKKLGLRNTKTNLRSFLLSFP